MVLCFSGRVGRVIATLLSLRSLVCQMGPCACWQVSSLGRVKNSHGEISSGCLHPSGYRTVMISQQGFKKCVSVHRLVALAFHGPPRSPLLVVNHIDGTRENNTMDNLEYVTRSQNALHSLTSRKVSERRGKSVMARSWNQRMAMLLIHEEGRWFIEYVC